MAVVVVKTSRKCKLCQHPRRVDIDAELDVRSRLNGQPDDKGVVHNLEYVLARFREFGVQNPTNDNIKSHWGNESKHSYSVTEEEAATAAVESSVSIQERVAVFERVLGPEWRERTPTPEQHLELVRALAPFEMYDKIVAGKPLGITLDQLDRSINTATRRNSEEQAASLIGSLAGAIEESARTAGKAIDAITAGEEPIEGEAAEVVGELPAGG